MEWLWVALAIVALVVELNTRRLVAVWVSVSAAQVILLRVIFPDLRLIWQGLIFIGLSALLILITYPVTKKILNKDALRERDEQA